MSMPNKLAPKKLSRRSLAKGLAFGALGASLPSTAEPSSFASRGAALEAPAKFPLVPLLPGVWRMRIGNPEPFTPVANRFIPAAEAAMRSLPQVASPPVAEILGSIDDRGTTVMLPLEPGENIYGFGLQMLSFNQRGKRKTLRVNADPRFDTGDSHAPVPFYVSTRGYGIFVDTSRYATFCCGTATRVGSEIVEQHAGIAEDAPKLKESDRATVTVEIGRAKGVEIYLFAGPAMLDVVRRFNLFSGGGVNPPEWGLGFWYRTQAKATADEALRMAQEFRERNIPCDVIGLEGRWQSHSYSCSFQWGAGFPNPAEFVRQIGQLNYKVNLWEHAFVHPTAPFHEAIAPYSGDYLVWQGLVPDFQTKAARDIFGDYHRKTFLDLGVSGFKLDECDNSDFTGGWSFPEFSRFPSGQDGEQMHSAFGLRYQQTLLHQYNVKRMPTYGLVRSSGALAAPYPFVLYSDLYDHRAFVRALVNSGFCGLLWCPEVRDAQGPDDLIRRMQTAVFSPLAMINGWYIANPPWKQQNRKRNNANDLEPGWEALEARCREVLQWRMLLLPYLRAAFARYQADGTPPFRALLMDDPGDAALADCDDQFMVGDRMMVAPLFHGETSRNVVLPKGDWHDFWSGAPVSGGQAIKIQDSFEQIPVYVKSGSVMPIGGLGNCTADPATRRLTVRIFGDGSLPFIMNSTHPRELRLSWKDGKGAVEQDGSKSNEAAAPPPYDVIAWIPGTQKFY